MPNPFMSQLKLARELEEKARRAKKMKEECEKLIEDLRARLDKDEKGGIDVSDAKKLFENGKKDYDMKDFESALSKFKDAQQLLERLENEKIDNIARECDKYLAILRDMGKDVSQYHVEMEQARQKAREDIEIGLRRFQEIKSELIGMVIRRLEMEIDKIKEGLEGIEEEKKREIESKLSTMEDYLKKGSVDDALRTLTDVQTLLREKFEREIDNIFAEGEKYESMLREMKVKVVEAIEYKGRAKELLNSMQFSLALEYAKKYLNKLKEIMGNFVKKSMEVLNSSIREGREIEADVSEAEKLMDVARKLFDEGKYREAIDTLKKAASSAEKAKFQRVLKEISQSKELFIKAREMGIDIKPSLEKLEIAKRRLREGKYKLALTEAKRGVELIERKLNRIEALKKELKKLKDFIEELKEKGLDVSEYMEELDKAEDKIDTNPDEVEEIIDNVRDALDTTLYDMAMQKSEELETYISIGAEHGIDFTEERMDIDRMVEYIQNGEYMKAIELAADTKVAIITKLKRKAEEIIGNLENFLKAHEIPEASKLVRKAVRALKEEDLLTAFVNLKEASDIVGEIRKYEIERKLKKIEEEVDFLAAYGTDVSLHKELIAKCKSDLAEKKFSSAMETLNSLVKELSFLQKNVVRDIFHSAKTMGVAAKKIGVKIEQTEVRDLLVKAKEALEKGDIRQAIRLSAKARDIAREYKERAEDVYKMLAETARKITAAKERGIDVTTPARMLVGAKKAFEDNRFDDAEKLIKSSMKELENILSREEVKRIGREITELSKVIEEIGIGLVSAEIRENIKNFKSLLSQKKYADANKLGKEILDILKKSLEEYLSGLVAKLEKTIYDLKQEGIVIPVRDEELSALKDSIIKGEYKKCYHMYQNLRKKISEISEAYYLYLDYQKKYSNLSKTALSINLALPDFSKELEEANKHARKGNYRDAIRIMNTVCREIEKRIRSKLYSTLRAVEDEIRKARQKGMRVEMSEAMLQKAKRLAEQFRVSEAMQIAIKALGEIERAGLQKEMAYSTLIQMEQKVRKMRSILPADIQNKASAAREYFEKGNYSACLTSALEVMDKIAEIESTIRILKDITAKTKRSIEMAYQIGIDVSDAIELYNKAKEAFQNKRFVESLELIKNAHKSVSGAVSDFMVDLGKKIDKYVEAAKRYGIEESTATQLAKEIREYLAKEDYDKVFEKFMELRNLIGERFEEKARERINKLKRKMKELADKGVDVKELETEMVELQSLMESREFNEFFRLADDIEKKVEEALPKYTESLLGALRNMLRKYSNLGVDFTEYEEKISELTKLYDEGAYDKILSSLNEIRDGLREKLTKEFTGILTKLERRAKEVGMRDTAPLKRMAEAIARGDFEKFMEMKNDFEKKIDKYMETAAKLRGILKEVREKINFASQLGIDTSYEEDAYKSAEMIGESDPLRAAKIAESILSSIDLKISDLKPRFSVDIIPVGKMKNTFRAKLIIENVGNADARNVEVVVGGDVFCEEELKIPVIKVGEKIEHIVKFKSTRENMNIVITVRGQRFDGQPISGGTKKFLNASQFPTEKNYEIVKAETKERCALCRGVIMPNMDMVVCKVCGAQYHLPCAKRFKKCIKCKTEFDFES